MGRVPGWTWDLHLPVRDKLHVCIHINPNCKFVLQLYSTQSFELEYINCTETAVDE